MKAPQFIASVILALVPLVLVINLISIGQQNQNLQAQLQSQQEMINKGSMAQQIGVNILKDVAAASVRDPNLKEVLSKNGYSVTVNPPPGTATAPSASPAATPQATP